MKIKRNKRVERNLRIRAARSAGRDVTPVLSWRRLRSSILPRRKPKSFLTLLEQDIAARAERLQRLEQAIFLPEEQPELAYAPVLEPVEEPQPEPEAAAEAADGRTNYQYVPASARVRRRIIL